MSMPRALVSAVFLAAAMLTPMGAWAAPTVIADLAVVEPSGVTVAERRVEVGYGEEGTAVIRKGNRAIDLKLTARPGNKAGCFMVEVALKDRDIDSTGQFSKKEWKTTSQVCGGQPTTLGPTDDTRVRISVRPKS
jgi:hypothetical protein